MREPHTDSESHELEPPRRSFVRMLGYRGWLWIIGLTVAIIAGVLIQLVFYKPTPSTPAPSTQAPSAASASASQ